MKFAFALLLMFFSLSVIKAQIVNIPDASLKHILTTDNCVDLNDDGVGDANADTNNDGEIQVNEAAAVEYLILDSTMPSMRVILDLTGLESFVNLKSFNSENVSFSEQQNIGGIFQYVGVDPIDFTSNSNLERINISDEVLISSINVSGLTNLTELRLFWVRPEFEVGSATPATVNMQGCVNLINLDLMDSYNVDIDFCQAPLLETLNCQAFGSSNLRDFNFNCLTNLRILNIGEVGFLNSLYLKNGSVLESLTSYSINGNVLCIDNNQDELDSLGSLVDSFEYVTTTCDVALGENTVSGAIQVYNTSNNGDCGTNNLRSLIKFDFIQNNTSVLNFQTSNTSEYELPVGQGDYQVVPTTNFSDGYDVVPNQFDVSFAGNEGELVEQDICLEPRVEIIDGIEIRFYPFSYASDPSINRFDAYIDLKNTNATNYSGQLRLVYDDNYSILIDYDETPDSDSNGEAVWNTINIGPNSNSRIFLRIGYNSDTHPNYPVFSGDELIYDLFLTNLENRNNQGGSPSFRLIQTIDAAEQTLNIENVDQMVSSSKIKIYPNPSSKFINIENNIGIKTVSIFSINGQLLNTIDYRKDNSEWIHIDISELDKGVYFLSIQTDTSIFTEKIIKN